MDANDQAKQDPLIAYLTQPICLLLSTSVILLLFIYWQGTRNQAILKKINAPGPKPWPFIGNNLDARKFNGVHLVLCDYIQRYGKVFAFTLGDRPSVVIADPDMLKQILVKDFWNFPNHAGRVDLAGSFSRSVFFARDDAWKRIRTTITPTFSAKKMKGMVALIEESCDRLMMKIEQVVDTGTSVEMLDWYSRMTLEVILHTAFGVQTDIQNEKESQLFERTKEVFHNPLIANILRRFPLGVYLLRLLNIALGKEGYFEKVASDIITKRRQSGITGRQDLLHLMLTANEGMTEEGFSKLTDEEIVGQCVIFLFAGYGTSSNTLAFITYYLATHQDVQNKLREEIQEAVKSNPDSTLYDLAHSIEYLDCVISEAQRLNPPLFQLSRECAKDYDIGGIHIPAGLEVIVPVYFLHHDPEAWPDPEKFDPERFRSPAKDTRHPYQFMPFGTGPRSCIGMRFALMEIKIVLIKFLLKYKFVPSPETQIPLAIFAGATLLPGNGIHLRIQRV